MKSMRNAFVVRIAAMETSTWRRQLKKSSNSGKLTYRVDVDTCKFSDEKVHKVQSECHQRKSYRSANASYVYLFTCERYSAELIVPTANPLNAVTNLPNTRSMSGSSVPAAMAAMKATPFSSQLVLSAYLNTRYFNVRGCLSDR
jgi:hypothetical protein